MFAALARLANTHPRRVLVLTVFFFVIGGAVGGPVAGLLNADNDSFSDTSSERARRSSASKRHPASQPCLTSSRSCRVMTAQPSRRPLASSSPRTWSPRLPARRGRSRVRVEGRLKDVRRGDLQVTRRP